MTKEVMQEQGSEQEMSAGAETQQDTYDSEGALEQIGKDLFPSTAESESAAEKPSRERDEQGRFVQKSDAKPEMKPEVKPGVDNTVKETVQPPAGAPEGEAAPQPLQPPNTWTKDALPFWEQTPPRVQAEILKREADMHRGLQQYRESAAVGQTFAKTLEPFIPALQKFQLNPSDVLKRALTAHLNLTLSPPDVKLRLFRGLAADYGIDVETLMDDMPLTQPDPETVALKQELAMMRQTVEGMQQRYFETRKAETLSNVNTFADDPKHQYFDELADDIAQLLQQGVAADLETAYEKALWLNPTVRSKELARQASERQAKTAGDEAERLAKAKQAAAANVRTQAHPSVAKEMEATGDMDSTLNSTLSEIRKRG